MTSREWGDVAWGWVDMTNKNVLRSFFCLPAWNWHTVDGSEIRLTSWTSWGNASLFHYLQSFIHPTWSPDFSHQQLHLKINSWKMKFLVGHCLFSGSMLTFQGVRQALTWMSCVIVILVPGGHVHIANPVGWNQTVCLSFSKSKWAVTKILDMCCI